MGASKRLFSN